MGKSVVSRVPKSYQREIEEMQEKILEKFAIKVSKCDASKVLIWKARGYQAQLSAKKLLEILGSNE